MGVDGFCKVIPAVTGIAKLFARPQQDLNPYISALNNQVDGLSSQLLNAQKSREEAFKMILEMHNKEKEKYTNLLNSYNSMIEKQVQSQKEIEEKEQKKKEIAKELNKKLINDVKILEGEQLSKIVNLFEKKKKLTWCKNDLEKIFTQEKFNKFINDLSSNLNLNELFENTIIKLANELNNKEKVNNFNIKIIGKTGVGKSALVNSLLQLKNENEKAKEGLGECITKETKAYENKNLYPGIKIYDTQGIELDENYSIKKMTENTVADIMKKLKQNIPSDLIHCLFYCINGTRFEGIEKQTIIDIRNTYEGKKLPIIVVHTRATVKRESEELKQKINQSLNEKFNEQLSDDKNCISFVSILAKTEEHIEQDVNDYGLDDDLKNINITRPFGLVKLMKLSFKKSQFCIKFACIMALKTAIIDKIILNLTQINQNLINSNFKLDTINSLINENDLENILMQITEIIFNKYLDEFKENNNENMAENINLRIQCVRDFLAELINDITNITRKNYEELKKIQVEKVKNYLLNEQIKKFNDSGIENGVVTIFNGEDIISLLNRDFDQMLEGLSTEYAFNNALSLFFDKISENFINMFKNEIIKKMKSKEGNLVNFFENLIGNKFSQEIINTIEKLINDLEKYQKGY